MFPISCIDGAAKQNPQTKLIVPHLGIRRHRGFICSVAGDFTWVYFTFEKDEGGGSSLFPRSPRQLIWGHRTCWPGGISISRSGPRKANPMTSRDCPHSLLRQNASVNDTAEMSRSWKTLHILQEFYGKKVLNLVGFSLV